MIGTFFTWDATSTSAMLGYMGDLFSDLTPLLTIVIGIGVGLIVIGAIIKAIRG